jgi:light-regulated signal transduction histidine kinase (bacteriophytochrome)
MQEIDETEKLRRVVSQMQMLVYGLGHDLREPIRVVSSFASLLNAHEADLPHHVVQYTRHIEAGVKRLETLTEGILAYAGLDEQAEVREPVELADAIQVAMLHLALAIEEAGADIRWTFLPTVLGNRTQYVQLFQNLLGNAIKYRGVHVPSIVVRAVPEGRGDWCISVEDNGAGIEAKYAELVFVPFRRIDAGLARGAGLGLAICRRIVEAQGGRIWVDTEYRSGARLVFTLPGMGKT